MEQLGFIRATLVAWVVIMVLTGMFIGSLAAAVELAQVPAPCRPFGQADSSGGGLIDDDFWARASESRLDGGPTSVYRHALGLGPLPPEVSFLYVFHGEFSTGAHEVWQAALQRVEPSLLRGISEVRCHSVYAAHTLNQMIDELGPSHPYVGQWLNGQAAVCSDSTLSPALPLAGAALAQRQIWDRRLQAAELLSGQAQEKLYLEIAASASPHRVVARYRLITHDGDRRLHFPAEEYREVSALLMKLLADPRLAAAHINLRRIVGKLSYDHADAVIDESLPASAEPPAGKVFGDMLIDTMLADLLVPAAKLKTDRAAQFAFNESREDLPRFAHPWEPDWWLGDPPHWTRQRQSAFARAARQSDLAA